MSMLRPHLQRPMGPMGRIRLPASEAVIDHEHKPALQLRREIVDPIERREIDLCFVAGRPHRQICQPRLRGRLFDKDKLIITPAHKFFVPLRFSGGAGHRPAATDQMHRHGIEQLVGKMNAGKWLERIDGIAPFDFAFIFRERLRLAVLQDGRRFEDSIAQSGEKFRPAFARGAEHVARKVAMMRALFDDDEVVDLVESLPHLRELRSQQLPEERTDAYAGEIISAAAN